MLQEKVDEVELQNERLRVAYESLRSEVAALRTGAVPGIPRSGMSGHDLGMSPEQAPAVDYISFPGVYTEGVNQGFGWGMAG